MDCKLNMVIAFVVLNRRFDLGWVGILVYLTTFNPHYKKHPMQQATNVLLMLISYTLIKAQNPSVILELESTNQGVLAPRMTEMQRTDISPLVEGLLVYQTDGSSGFYFYNGNNWVSLSSGITEADTVNWNGKQDELTGTATGEMLYWDGSSW